MGLDLEGPTPKANALTTEPQLLYGINILVSLIVTLTGLMHKTSHETFGPPLDFNIGSLTDLKWCFPNMEIMTTATSIYIFMYVQIILGLHVHYMYMYLYIKNSA